MKRNVWLLLVALICSLVVYAVDDGFEAYVDNILDGMADEDGVGEHDIFGDPYADDPYSETTSGGRGLTGITEFGSIAEIDKFISADADKPAVIGYFDLATSGKDLDVFEKLGVRDNEHYRYGYITNKVVLEEKRYSGCTVVVHMAARFFNPDDDKPKARYPNKSISDIVALKTFVRQKAVPLVGEMTIHNEKLYRNTRLPVVTIFALIEHEKNPKGFKYLLNRVRKVAKLFRGAINFNIADARTYFKDMNQKYEFEETYTEHPISVGLRDRAVYYAMPQGEFSVDRLRRFVEDFQANQLDGNDQFDDFMNKDEDDVVETVSPHAPTKGKKTTPDAKKNPKRITKKVTKPKPNKSVDADTEVIVLTDVNANDVLNTPNVDVFVEFFAPWCGHCQMLAPELRETTNAFKQDDGVIVAALDADTNKVPSGFKVSGYPTLYFIPANNKKHPVVYAGPRKAADMTQYINTHRTTSVGKGSALFSALLEGEQRGVEEENFRKEL